MSAQSTSLPTRADVRDGPSADTVRAVDYEGDLVAWAEANARLLRLGRLEEVDAEHIAEELEDMGKSERRALGSHLQNLVMHLLKWQYQPQRRGRSWRFSVLNARASVQAILDDSPSLAPRVEALMQKSWHLAREQAIAETGLPEERFPEACPYGIEQVLDSEFWPNA